MHQNGPVAAAQMKSLDGGADIEVLKLLFPLSFSCLFAFHSPFLRIYTHTHTPKTVIYKVCTWTPPLQFPVTPTYVSTAD